MAQSREILARLSRFDCLIGRFLALDGQDRSRSQFNETRRDETRRSRKKLFDRWSSQRAQKHILCKYHLMPAKQ